jgi:hypothetical protein
MSTAIQKRPLTAQRRRNTKGSTNLNHGQNNRVATQITLT